MSDSNPTDATLLDRLAAGDRTALAEIARRYVDVVHGAARRQTGGDLHLADDVTQAVFLTLCRRAGSLRKGTILVGWLYTTTRNIAMTARRASMRRDRHERSAAAGEWSRDASAEHDGMLPLLDDALHALPARDREAVLLRFFHKLAFAEVGERIGTSEEGARKRVTRAVERLRERFARSGLATTTTAAVAALLTAESTKAAPATTVAAVSSGTATAGATTLAASTTAASAAGAAGMSIGAKVAAGVVAAALAAGGTAATIAVVKGPAPVSRSGATTQTSNAALSNALRPAIQANARRADVDFDPAIVAQPWFANFRDAYALREGETVRHVAYPFIDERMSFYRWANLAQAAAVPDGPTYLVINGSFHHDHVMMSFSGPPVLSGAHVKDLLNNIGRLMPYEYEVPDEMAGLPTGGIPGDWVYDADAPQSERLAAIAGLLKDEFGVSVAFEPQLRDELAVVVTGSRAYAGGGDQIEIHTSTGPSIASFAGGGGVSHLLRGFSEASKWPVIDEREDRADWHLLNWSHSGAAGRRPSTRGAAAKADVEALFGEIAQQTGLQYKLERRTITVWVMKQG